MTKVQAEIGEMWRAISREMHDRFRHAFRDFELPLMSMLVLREIHQQPGITVSDLGRRTATAKSHVSKMVEQLVQRALLEKRLDPEDQRLVRIHLTPHAKERIEQLEARAREIWSQVLSDVAEPDLAEAAHGLRILLTALERSRDSAANQPLGDGKS